MKIYAIIQEASGKVVAISESKKDTALYMLEKNFSDRDYFFTKIKNDKLANDMLFDFDDLYLEHDAELDMVLTRVELQMIHDILGEERGRIRSTLVDLEHYLKNYSFSKKEKKLLIKAHDLLSSAKKKKNLRHVLDLDVFIGFVTKSKNIADVFRDKLHDMKEKMYLFINLKE
jgi:hypothetical protein